MTPESNPITYIRHEFVSSLISRELCEHHIPDATSPSNAIQYHVSAEGAGRRVKFDQQNFMIFNVVVADCVAVITVITDSCCRCSDM